MPGPIKPYVKGVGPIPNDEYGEGHMMVDPAFSKRTNMNITNQHTSDGNIGELETLYGTPGVPADPFGGAEHGLNIVDDLQYRNQSRSLKNSMNQMKILFGEDAAVQILDEVMRVAASQDANGPMQQPDFSNMPPATPQAPQPQKMDPMSIIRSGAAGGGRGMMGRKIPGR